MTSAASPTGAAICRELLNSNANVLGIDSIPAHQTTNAQLGSHFQFFKYSQGSSHEGKDIIEHAKEMYTRDNIDFLIDVITGETEDSVVEIIRELVNVMQTQGEGLVLNVLAGNAKDVNTEKQAVCSCLSRFLALIRWDHHQFASANCMRRSSRGWRPYFLKSMEKEWDVMLSFHMVKLNRHIAIKWLTSLDISSTDSAGTAIDKQTKVALKEHIKAHIQRRYILSWWKAQEALLTAVDREKGGYAVDQNRDLANLVLFLCTRLGNEVSGALIGSGGVLAGTWCPNTKMNPIMRFMQPSFHVGILKPLNIIISP